MEATSLRRLAAALAAVLAAGPATAQAPSSPAPAGALAGTWTGTGTFSDDRPTQPCRYAGGSSPPSVTLELGSEGGGAVTIEVPAPGSACPALHERWQLHDVAATASTVSFRDAAGRESNLALRGEELHGIMAWKQGDSRLSGEVALARSAAAPQAAASPAPGAEGGVPAGGTAPRQGSRGLIGGLGAVISANVVGIGGIVLANKLLQDKTATSGSGQGCSLRSCTGNLPADCASCNNATLVAGQSCGQVSGGVAINQPCSPPGQPCQANLSCNNFICQDQAGLCPF